MTEFLLICSAVDACMNKLMVFHFNTSTRCWCHQDYHPTHTPLRAPPAHNYNQVRLIAFMRYKKKQKNKIQILYRYFTRTFTILPLTVPLLISLWTYNDALCLIRVENVCPLNRTARSENQHSATAS